jgi:hypothetical protein
VYLYVGGQGTVTLHGKSYNRLSDGTYSIDGSTPRSLPTSPVKRQIGQG